MFSSVGGFEIKNSTDDQDSQFRKRVLWRSLKNDAPANWACRLREEGYPNICSRRFYLHIFARTECCLSDTPTIWHIYAQFVPVTSNDIRLAVHRVLTPLQARHIEHRTCNMPGRRDQNRLVSYRHTRYHLTGRRWKFRLERTAKRRDEFIAPKVETCIRHLGSQACVFRRIVYLQRVMFVPIVNTENEMFATFKNPCVCKSPFKEINWSHRLYTVRSHSALQHINTFA